MVKRIVLQLLVVMLVGVTSCTPVVYSTVGQNVPLFKEKGEISMGAAFGSADRGEGLSLQGSGAVSDHVALIGSFYTLSEENTGDDVWSGKGSYLELGAGTFGTMNPRKNLVYEVFGGVGFGKIENHRTTATATSTANVKYFKPFIQPSIGYTSKWFEAAFTPRFGLVSYTDHEFMWSDPNEATILESNFEKEKNTWVLEPGFMVRTGYKGIKLQFQINFSTFSPFEEDEDGNKPGVNDEFYSIGLNYMISKRYKEK